MNDKVKKSIKSEINRLFRYRDVLTENREIFQQLLQAWERTRNVSALNGYLEAIIEASQEVMQIVSNIPKAI